MIKTRLTELIGIKHPIIQAGMGPLSTNELCIAAANAGILGLISSSGLFSTMYGPKMYETLARSVGADPSIDPLDLLREIYYKVLRETKNSGGIFGTNVMVSEELRGAAEGYIETMIEVRKEDSDMEKRMRVIVTSAGDPLPWRDIIKPTGMIWLHVVPSVRGAKRCIKAGCDGIIASGHEAGFHTAWDPVHSMVLLPDVAESVDVPVVGAGGFCDGKTLAAALALGAEGVQMGTRFLATKESSPGFPDFWRNAVLNAGDIATVVARGMVGPARYIKTPASLRLAELTADKAPKLYIGKADDLFTTDSDILDAEIIGFTAAYDGDEENALAAGGECAQRINDMPTVKEVVDRTIKEAEDIIKKLPNLIV